MADLILALDQGTTSSRALIIDSQRGTILAIHGVPFQQHYPQKGWVAHDLSDIWGSTLAAIEGAIAQLSEGSDKHSAKDIKAIGITNQRETTCAFAEGSGDPLGHAIVWQCKRSLDICRGWQAAGLAPTIQSRTGLRLDPYFSGSKIAWWQQNEPALAADIASGKALIGTVDTFLLYKLTGGLSYKTEPSNASRTLLYDLKKGDFSQELTEALGLPAELRLPEVVASDSRFGVTKGVAGLPDGIPITGILGDQQAALLGQGCLRAGEGKCTYGTGAFLLVNIGETLPEPLPDNLLTTAFMRTREGSLYALEGASFIAGAAVDYLKSPLGFVAEPQEASAILAEQRAAPDVYFVPGFSGLGSPHWLPEAQGAYLGLTRDTTKEQLVAATMEGIAFTVGDMLKEMTALQPLTTLNVDGGLSQSGPLMQFQADIAKVPIAVSQSPEATAMGAAFMAAYGAGLVEDFGQLKEFVKAGARFAPQADAAGATAAAHRGWQGAIAAVKAFAEGQTST